jgi:hypothetical protein
MKKNQLGSDPLSPDTPSPPEKSFSVAFEQMAKFLRTEIKMKDRSTKILSSNALSISFNNSLKRIAKLLRTQVHTLKTPKKRSWKNHPPKRKKECPD